jgi:hypothetical protein
LGTIIGWAIPLGILALIIAGFFRSGTEAGLGMVKWWVLANGVLAALGALAAFAHPATIAASFAAAPFTSLNPMIAAGWVAGLVEASVRKPRVSDFRSSEGGHFLPARILEKQDHPHSPSRHFRQPRQRRRDFCRHPAHGPVSSAGLRKRGRAIMEQQRERNSILAPTAGS